ncbi:MAG: HAMP domain-containing histidine kinase, partial [Slackia piriformis]|nr:HAMP domain-containing histidine kinase [Slackia piriformis]
MVVVAIACAAVLAAFVLAFVAVSYERELRSMARFLEERERGSNERLTVEFSTRGIAGLARAVNDELDAQRDARVERDRREQAFREDLAALSHDIRTPLAGAQGYVQLYERTADEEQKRRYLAAAQERLAAMRALTDDLFEYAKASDEQHPLGMEPVCLFSAVADVLAGMYPQFAERGWAPDL